MFMPSLSNVDLKPHSQGVP